MSATINANMQRGTPLCCENDARRCLLAVEGHMGAKVRAVWGDKDVRKRMLYGATLMCEGACSLWRG
eukprot:15430411-Alexandrium_andersonii.AAC.1